MLALMVHPEHAKRCLETGARRCVVDSIGGASILLWKLRAFEERIRVICSSLGDSTSLA